MRKSERQNDLKRIRSSSSLRSTFSKSQRSGASGSDSGFGGDEGNDFGEDYGDEEQKNKLKTDPIVRGLDNFFTECNKHMETNCRENINTLTSYYNNKVKVGDAIQTQETNKTSNTADNSLNFN